MNDFDDTFDGVEHAAAERSASLAVRMARRAVLRQLRALHHGRSADGRLLYPAFPYTHTTLLTRTDADALLAYLRSLPPSPAQPPAHELRWPYSTQAALAVWPEYLPAVQGIARATVRARRSDERLARWLEVIAMQGEDEGWVRWARERGAAAGTD